MALRRRPFPDAGKLPSFDMFFFDRRARPASFFMMVSLRFPGNLLVRVAPETRLEMFPPADGAEVVEYRIGTPAVRFAVLRAVVEASPQSFLAVQLANISRMQGDLAGSAIRLADHDPLMFPLVFAYLNDSYARPRAVRLPFAGLSFDEAAALRELMVEYLGLGDRYSLLFAVQHMEELDASRIRLVASGRLCGECPEAYPVSTDGTITCAYGSVGMISVNLRRVPTDGTWPARIPGSAPRYPDADQAVNFFIPATAIRCMAGETPVECEGIYYADEDRLRVDAVDQPLWLEVRVVRPFY